MDDNEIDIEVSEEDYARLEAGAKAEGLTVEEFVLKIVEDLIRRYEEEKG